MFLVIICLRYQTKSYTYHFKEQGRVLHSKFSFGPIDVLYTRNRGKNSSNIQRVLKEEINLNIFKYIFFMSKIETFTKGQQSFKKERSTESVFIKMTQYIFDELNRNELVVSLSFELTRTFDTLSIDFIWQKLEALGIRKYTNKWIVSFLSDSTIIVKTGITILD